MLIKKAPDEKGSKHQGLGYTRRYTGRSIHPEDSINYIFDESQ